MGEHLKDILAVQVGKPQLVVGLSRGGLTPGVVLSHALGVPFHPLVWSTRDHARTDTAGLEYVEQCAENGPIIIVDDICDSGRSFIDVSNALGPASKRNVIWAAMYARAGAKFVPDVVGEHVTSDAWIHFSWELAGQAIRNGDPLL